MSPRSLQIWLCLPLLLAGFVWQFALAESDSLFTPKTQFRRPIALGLLDGGKMLCVANRQSGSLSLIDPQTLHIVGEFDVGKQLADLATLPGGRKLLVVDEAGGELIALAFENGKIKSQARLKLNHSPVSVVANEEGTQCYVASLWARQLTIIEIDSPSANKTGAKLQLTETVELPFEPRSLLLLPGETNLVVADAFGGKIAIVDVERKKLVSVRELPAHNLRGLTMNSAGDELLVAHQILNPLARTSFEDLHRGMLIKNVVRRIPLANLLDPQADLLQGGRVLPLGDVGNGAADPADVAMTHEGQLAVAIAGVGEVIIRPETTDSAESIAVGRRPTALLSDTENGLLYVANTFSDSISVIRTTPKPTAREVPLGPTPQPLPHVRGEMLFFDARLSHDHWLSCHSCHTEGHTCGLMADTLGDGSYGAAKRIPTLLGVSRTDNWAWNGSIKELQQQIHNSVQTSMHGTDFTGKQANDITAFLHKLSPPPPLKPHPKNEEDGNSLARGRTLFGELKCAKCHVPPLTYTTQGTFEVGLSDEVGNNRFNPPSLRGVGRRRGYFHDKRAGTLVSVFDEHQHQLDRSLSNQELGDLVRFLESL